MLLSIDVYKNLTDYIWGWGSLVGAIAIPVLIWFFGSFRAEAEKNRHNKIQVLNYLTLYSHNLLIESSKLRINEKTKRLALEKFINEPNRDNYKNAFSIMQIPTLQYEIFAGDYTFTAENYPQLIDLIFRITTSIKDIQAFVLEVNRFGDIASTLTTEKQIEIANMVLNQLDIFHNKVNVLIYYLDKIGISVSVFNSCFFYQKLVKVIIEGDVKNSINLAVVELEEKNKFKNPNWKNDFIDAPNNPPIKLTLRAILEIAYLKFHGYLDNKITDLRQFLYQTKNKKLADEFRNIKSPYNREAIDEYQNNLPKIQEMLNDIKGMYDKLETYDKQNLYLWKGFIRKLEQMIKAAENIYSIFPPNRNILLSPEEIYDVTIQLNYIVSNYISCINNLFQFMALYFNSETEIESITFLTKEIYPYPHEQYYEKMKDFYNSWLYKYTEAFDEGISYGLPFELATKLENSSGELLVGTRIIAPPKFDKNDDFQKVGLHQYVVQLMQTIGNISKDIYNIITTTLR